MSVHEKLQKIFRTVFDKDDLVISDDMSAKDIPDWDSLAQINLVVAAEGEFGVRFLTAEIRSLKNVGEFERLIQAKLASGAGP